MLYQARPGVGVPAIGSGGVFGKGWMHGSQAQLQFLPERSTDFIFAVIGEEFGFLGLALLYDERRSDEAVAHARAAIAISEEALGPEHPDFAAMVCNLAIVEMEVGRLDDALAAASRSVGIYQMNISVKASSTGERISISGRGSRTSVSSTTGSACGRFDSSLTLAKAGE